jgi:hypothetical protein
MRLYRTLCVMLIACMSQVAVAQEKAQPMSPDAMMEAYRKATAPGEPHKMLGDFVGSWVVTAKMWMAPGQPPTESTGSAEVTSIFEGRFIQEEFHGSMMGESFTGIGMTGYDNATKKYVSTWTDSMSTNILRTEGAYDATKKAYTYEASYVDPLMGPKTMRIVQRVIDKNNHVSEFYEPGPDGQWVKSMELAYKRK